MTLKIQTGRGMWLAKTCGGNEHGYDEVRQ